MADAGARAACVVVTYDALPWIERCLASVIASGRLTHIPQHYCKQPKVILVSDTPRKNL